MDKNDLTVEQTSFLYGLIEQENEKAIAINTLLSWGAGDRCAADDQTDIEEALNLLDAPQDDLLCYALCDELDAEELRGWVEDWYKLPVDWNDSYDVREAWRSVCQSVNECELHKIAVAKFEELFALPYFIARTGLAKKKIAEIAGVTPVTVTRWVNGDTPAPPLVLEKLRQIDKVING